MRIKCYSLRKNVSFVKLKQYAKIKQLKRTWVERQFNSINSNCSKGQLVKCVYMLLCSDMST